MEIPPGKPVWYVVSRSMLPRRPSTFVTSAQSAGVVGTGSTRLPCAAPAIPVGRGRGRGCGWAAAGPAEVSTGASAAAVSTRRREGIARAVVPCCPFSVTM